PEVSAISFGMITADPGSAKNESSGANGAFILTATVSGPFADIVSRALNTGAPRGFSFPQRLSEATTSAAVSGPPLWNVTSFRRVSVYARPSLLTAYDDTRDGCTRQLASNANNVSKIG